MAEKLIVYGASWCPDCHRSRTYLDNHNVQYDWIDIDEDSAAAEKVAEINNGMKSIPTIVFPDKSVLVEPSDKVLEEKLITTGILGPEKQDTDNTPPKHEVIMVGAGPAALTAAIYTTRENIDTLLFERGVIGGLAAVTDKVDNYPGFPEGIAGLELADNLRKQAERFGAVIELGEVSKIHDEGEYKRLETTSGEMYAKAVLVATGSDYKKANVAGEQEYYAHGVHYCATCDGAFYKDKRLVVIGGGNSALQESMFLTRFASHIDLLVRSDKFKASEVLQKELETHTDKITVHMNTSVKEIVGDDGKVTKVAAVNNKTNETFDIDTDGVFVFVGLKPNSEFLRASGIECDEIGFVKTDGHLQTTMKGVFAAGDIRSGSTMQIATAVGEGSTAALIIREYLEGKLDQNNAPVGAGSEELAPAASA